MKMVIFWVFTPCSLVEVYQCLRDTCCLHYQGDGLIMEASSTSGTSVNFYLSTRRNNPEDRHSINIQTTAIFKLVKYTCGELTALVKDTESEWQKCILRMYLNRIARWIVFYKPMLDKDARQEIRRYKYFIWSPLKPNTD
jgi:hypothetical protein